MRKDIQAQYLLSLAEEMESKKRLLILRLSVNKSGNTIHQQRPKNSSLPFSQQIKI